MPLENPPEGDAGISCVEWIAHHSSPLQKSPNKSPRMLQRRWDFPTELLLLLCWRVNEDDEVSGDSALKECGCGLEGETGAGGKTDQHGVLGAIEFDDVGVVDAYRSDRWQRGFAIVTNYPHE